MGEFEWDIEPDLLLISPRMAQITGLPEGAQPAERGEAAWRHVHPNDLGEILDREGIAVRTGQHCAHPVMQRFGISATARASLGCYNTKEELDALVQGLAKARRLLT